MKKPKIKLTIVDGVGKCGCHRGHKIGDTFDFDEDRVRLCPMAFHSGFPYIDILRYGGDIPKSKSGDYRFACPDADTILIFKIEVVNNE